MRQESKTLRTFLGKWDGATKTAKQTGQAVYSYIQEVTEQRTRCLAIGKTGPARGLSSPGILLAVQFRPFLSRDNM